MPHCYRRAIDLAAEHGCARVAIPAISTGVFRYPVERVAPVAIGAVRQAMVQHPAVVEVRFWQNCRGAAGWEPTVRAERRLARLIRRLPF